MTPLFPENSAITISQGHTGDCYLLTAIDCILNSGDEGLKLVKSLFKETPDGVEVRIKRTELFDSSKNFQPEKMRDKYTYHYDEKTNEDVFFLNKERMKVIDGYGVGVSSNSLAIKILERISAYYYTGEWSNQDPLASIAAHNMHNRFNTSSTVFVAKFIGVEANDTDNIDAIIRLKLINPKEPVYISMSYGKADIKGMYHGRHALRIDSIIQKRTGFNGVYEYEFVLINPWDNTKTEKYTLEDIKKRNFRFCTFNLDSYKPLLLKGLELCNLDVAKEVFADTTLYNLIKSMHSKGMPLTEDAISSVHALYKANPGFETLYRGMKEDEQVSLAKNIEVYQVSPNTFCERLINDSPTVERLKLIYNMVSNVRSFGFKVSVGDFWYYFGGTLTNLMKKDAGQLLAQECNTVEFFRFLVAQAVKSKMAETSLNETEARQIVEEGLLDYYLARHSNNALTRSAGIRSLIVDNKVSIDFIAQMYSERELCVKIARGLLFNYKSPYKEFVNFLKLEQIDADLVQQVLAQRKSTKPEYIFTMLHSLIRPHDSAKADKFAKVLVDNYSTYFNTSLKELQQKILGSKPETDTDNQFKVWFAEQTGAAFDPNAFLEIETLKREIHSIQFDFSGLRTVPELEEQSLQKSLKLRQFEEKITLLNTTHTAYPKELGDMLLSIASKRVELKKSFDVQKEALERARSVIDELELQISGFDTTLRNPETVRQLSELARSKTRQLEDMVKAPNVEQSKKVLGIVDLPATILSALQLKKQKIEQLRAAMENSIQARLVYQERLHQIRAFVVNFDGCESSHSISQRASLLIGRLNDIMKSSQLDEALNQLGAFERRTLTDLVNEKKASISGQRAQLYAIAVRREQSEKLIKDAVNDVWHLKVDFTDLNTFESLSQRKAQQVQFIKAKLECEEIRDAALYSKLPHDLKKIAQDKKLEISEKAEQQAQILSEQHEEIINQVSLGLTNLMLDKHLTNMDLIFKYLRKKRDNDPATYQEAFNRATALRHILTEEHAKLFVFDVNKPADQRLSDFRTTLEPVVRAAMEELQQHRGIKKYLAMFLDALSSIPYYLNLSSEKPNQFRFFSAPPYSASLVHEFDTALQAIPVVA